MSEAEMIGRTVRHLAVCIPAYNEAARLPVLLDALAAQTWSETIPVSLALNNCDDDSLSVAQAVARRHADRLAISISNVSFEAPLAHAGSARKLAMDRGLRLLPSLEHSILVSTDADTRPPPDWLASLANAFDRGARLVRGVHRSDAAGTERPSQLKRRRPAAGHVYKGRAADGRLLAF